MFNILYWTQVAIFRSIILLHRSILAVCYWKKSKTVPPIKNPLLLKSAKDLAEDIRKRKLKSREIVQAYIDRILEVEPFLNAVVQDRFKEALEEASEVDEFIESEIFSEQHIEENKPLLGVPFTVKALLKVKGHSFSAGCRLFKDRVADEDAPSVAILKNAGGIIIATSNIPEFGFAFETQNFINGRTCNPYDTCRTPGGSSGGESALLAAGASAIGIGSDMCGSVRVPAHFSGIYAHKPTRGLISNDGSFPLTMVPNSTVNDYISIGPMSRFAEDLVLMMKILTAENKKCVKFDEKVDFKKLKIFYSTSSKDPRVQPLDKDIEDGIHKAISHFTSSYGVTAQQIDLPIFDKANDIAIHLLHPPVEDLAECLVSETSVPIHTFTEIYHLLLGNNANYSLGSLIGLNILRSPLFIKKQNIPYHQDLLKQLIVEFDNLLDDHSVLICPTFPVTAPYHYEMISFLNLSSCYTSIINFIGMPSTAVPIGLNRNGMPQGLQIIGKKNYDPLTIACAVEIGKLFGGWIPPGK